MTDACSPNIWFYKFIPCNLFLYDKNNAEGTKEEKMCLHYGVLFSIQNHK